MRSPCLLAAVLWIAAAWPAGAEVPRVTGTEQEALRLLRDLVGADTSLGKNTVPRLEQDLANRFRTAGFGDDDIFLVPSGETAALVVRYRGTGAGGRPVGLLGHLDVVAARPEEWGRNPFELVESDNYLIGRGVLDVKGEVALLVTTLLGLKSEGYIPSRDLILVLTGDEETTGYSSEALLAKFPTLFDAEFALNADTLGGGTLSEADGLPILFRVQGSEKASARFTLTTRNPGGHSSQPRPDNAIYELADALKAVQSHRFPLRWNAWTLGDFAGTGRVIGGELGDAMRQFAEHPAEGPATRRIGQEPPFAGRLRTTCVATELSGGHAPNALPQTASATLSCRIFPGDTMQSVHRQLQQIVGPGVAVLDGPPVSAGPGSPLRDDVMQAVRKTVEEVFPGATVVPTQSSYATDSATFRLAGLPTYGVSGIFIKESEQFAHGLNERIPTPYFFRALRFWRSLLMRVAELPGANAIASR